MLTDVHILLTYQCTFECDHCFLFSGPVAEGTMTLARIDRVLEESAIIGTVEWIYFEGGEPFLFYPLLLEGVKRARAMGFQVGIVTNGYWAQTAEDAELWLRPLHELGLGYLSVSNDWFHYGDRKDTPAEHALAAARKLGVNTSAIVIKKPYLEEKPGEGQGRGVPVIGGGAMFKGRAVETLTNGLPKRNWRELKECPYEMLQSPARVHVDPYGHVHICQGISMGNMFQVPLSEVVARYNAAQHPICAPLIDGGPAGLARHHDVKHEHSYVDECHFCYSMRLKLLDRFTAELAPPQVYGIQTDSK